MPMSAAVDAEVDATATTATFRVPAGVEVPTGTTVSLTGSHIRPQPGFGYDERRHVTVWGTAAASSEGRLQLRAEHAWGWDESECRSPSTRSGPSASRTPTTTSISDEQGQRVRPRLGLGWLTLRATRLPFLSATLIPVVVGIAIAAAQGWFDLLTAISRSSGRRGPSRL